MDTFFFILFVAECTVGHSVQDRVGYVGPNVVFVMTSEVILCDGEVTQWMFWAGSSGRIRAMIVSPDAGNQNRFTIVGTNDITVSSSMTNQATTYRIPTDERIMVKSGEMIAVADYSEPDSPSLRVTYSHLQEIRTRTVAMNTATLAPGVVFTTTSSTGNHEPSFAANISSGPPPGNYLS